MPRDTGSMSSNALGPGIGPHRVEAKEKNAGSHQSPLAVKRVEIGVPGQSLLGKQFPS